jgi:hypothetical protein
LHIAVGVVDDGFLLEHHRLHVAGEVSHLPLANFPGAAGAHHDAVQSIHAGRMMRRRLSLHIGRGNDGDIPADAAGVKPSCSSGEAAKLRSARRIRGLPAFPWINIQRSVEIN